ncbi:Leucine-rich repeat [Trypanosoma melophagium]|uniref:Leucine-rich repeat n=1 Tax=Trypanosoma melophagium TaxID=715481 RepID=UPI003519EE74|nr:Leucine-rich repeat [Trypanosoma melophagium]
MERPQLTLDAAYKFTLWYGLFSRFLNSQEKGSECEARDKWVTNVATSLIRTSLPRKIQRTCCLSGACGRNSLTHKKIHFGRGEVSVARGERDDVCACLAHATACLGRPISLFLREYSSSPSLAGDGHEGLRCMLRHMVLRSVTFSGIPDFQDAKQVVSELSKTLGTNKRTLTRLSLGGLPSHVTITSLFHSLSRTDTVTELRLEHCYIDDVTDLVEYMNASRQLQRLSLRGNKEISKVIGELANGISSCSSLLFFDMGHCGLKDSHLAVFLSNLSDFAHRTRFYLDISNNLLTNECFLNLSNSPPSFRRILTHLNLSGHDFRDCGRDVVDICLELSALTGIVLDHCDLNSRDVVLLVRELYQSNRHWSQLSFCGSGLTLEDIKRLARVEFAQNASFSVAGNRLGSCLQKLNLTSVIRLLSVLDLSLCEIEDEGVVQLAKTLEIAQPVSLRVLRLENNNIGTLGNKGCVGLQFLGRALRARYAPYLEVLSLAKNKLSLRPLLTLVEQVSCSLKELNISYSSIATNDDQLIDLLGTIIKRQKAQVQGGAFNQLDVWALRSSDVDVHFGIDVASRLEGQRVLRVIMEVK